MMFGSRAAFVTFLFAIASVGTGQTFGAYCACPRMNANGLEFM